MPSQSTGLLYALGAFSIFAVQDGISKHLGQYYPPVFVVMLRYWAFAVFAVILAARSHDGLKATKRARLTAAGGERKRHCLWGPSE